MLRPLEDISIEEKIAAYDILHEAVTDYVEQVQELGTNREEDLPHYIFESTVMQCLGPDVFEKEINPYL